MKRGVSGRSFSLLKYFDLVFLALFTKQDFELK